MRVTLYSKPDCHLCETLKADLLAMQSKIGFTLLERNIEEDPDDFLRFRYLIPVLDIEGGTLLYPPHTWHTVFQAIVRAEQNAAQSP
ncbi:MAG TPA: glutaredoxin family protein [Caldilineaceae bacterium]|nr:glutaredoxin family protein [Caldilineaceae bacterium]